MSISHHSEGQKIAFKINNLTESLFTENFASSLSLQYSKEYAEIILVLLKM